MASGAANGDPAGPRSPAQRRQADRRRDGIGGDPLAEHPAGPTLVDHHDRRDERCGPRHDDQGVVKRMGKKELLSTV